MAHSLDEIRRIKDAAAAELMGRPGVTGVDVGYKYVGGQRTDEVVICVHVEEKKDVPAAERITATIQARTRTSRCTGSSRQSTGRPTSPWWAAR